ncbi:hypothetical protein BKA00_004771 [Actinomadura coerulea]|uniref:Uncharacterized protein n=1 Tax=Actinomadura coerulea TaxID=46159 RepID=A0A7X0G1U0_9ACTN|nr:hypothetical protein [Actinomadura coerulea]MBB6397857.1 hypothetical protein [Actinomadura coerulea]GGQ19071.1 hypothetical protein GCM10010187_39310 [Actinomadura coerulea]
MSGPRDAREPGEPAGEAAPLKLPAFGLEAPWWAAESADTAPSAEQAPAMPEMLSAPVVEDARDEAGVSAPQVPAAPPAASAPPGTLVAGAGVPRVDSRGAVPAEPIVKPPISPDETDPEGFPPVPPVQGGFRDARPRGGGAGAVTPETEATVDHPAVTDSATGTPASLSAFEKAKEAEDAASLAPVLVPDAILPPGVVPPTGSGPFPHADPAAVGAAGADQAPGSTPLFHTDGTAPADAPPPGHPPQGMPVTGRSAGKGRPVLIGGVAAVILAAVGALFLIGGTDSDGDQDKGGKTPEAPAAARTTPAVTPSATATVPVDITNEKTDTADLTFRDVFPTETIRFGDRTYLRDRWSLNRDVTYAARGSMLAALRRDQCRKIVRATYIDPQTKLAVTSGIAVMPTKAAAIAVSKAGDPARYEWFRGMAGKRSPDIDQAGGYAAATVRGRYVAYAYVQWANGKKAKPGDPTIKKAAQLFLDYDLRPIVARSRG